MGKSEKITRNQQSIMIFYSFFQVGALLAGRDGINHKNSYIEQQTAMSAGVENGNMEESMRKERDIEISDWSR